jgi:exonuclease SbcC
MIRRIVLENYMSHAHSVIEPAAEGLTVLVGPNNCGKSAFVSALLTVCGENDGGFMVRHGEKLARVTIETAEGDVIVWQRKRGKPSYEINGREVHRVGRGNLPDDLQTLLKLPAIEFGEGATRSRFMVHFGLQKEPVFLIDSESDVAKFFSSSAESERLLRMQKKHREKATRARVEQQSVQEDLKVLDEQLASLSPLDELANRVEAVECEYAAVLERARAAEELADRIAQMESAGAAVDVGRARVDASAGLRAAPPMDDPTPLDRLIARLARVDADSVFAAARQAALHALEQPPKLGDEAALSRAADRMSDALRAIDEAQHRVEAIRSLSDPPVQQDADSLTRLGKQLKQAEDRFRQLVAQLAVLDNMLGPPAQDDLAPLAQTVGRIGVAERHVKDQATSVAQVGRQLEDVKEQIVAWVAHNPLCPVCGSPTRKEAVLETGGGTNAA